MNHITKTNRWKELKKDIGKQIKKSKTTKTSNGLDSWKSKLDKKQK